MYLRTQTKFIKTTHKILPRGLSSTHYFPPQRTHIFIKRKFGLFKITAYKNKYVKNQLVCLSNFIKFKKFERYARPSSIYKKPKIIFYKKITKLFFRAGRNLLINKISIKKNYTQTFLTKRITSVIKNDWTCCIDANKLSSIIVNTNLFYSFKDVKRFIYEVGIITNFNHIYSPDYPIDGITRFSLPFSKNFLHFVCKKRIKIISSLKKIKFFKFRSKMFKSKYRYDWVPSYQWVLEHYFLYMIKTSSIEFDLRALTGIVVVTTDLKQFYYYLNNIDTSLFMTRSYNWKYIT